MSCRPLRSNGKRNVQGGSVFYVKEKSKGESRFPSTPTEVQRPKPLRGDLRGQRMANYNCSDEANGFFTLRHKSQSDNTPTSDKGTPHAK
jgi:hypothetical protein